MTKQTGFVIRKLRLAKSMTLAQLGEKSGVPLSTLSKVELGQLKLGYDKLMQVCRALDIDAGMAMLADIPPNTPYGRRAMYRNGEGDSARLGPHDVKIVAGELISKAFTPLIVEVQAREIEEHGPFVELTGEAYLHVLEGALALHTEIYAPAKLQRGEGIYFDARLPHALLTLSPTPCKVLFVFAGEDQAFAPG